MRDPLAPIPSPERDPGFWQCTETPTRVRPRERPRVARVGPSTPARDAEYDPLRLLRRNLGDMHGLDRRARRRSHAGYLDAEHSPIDHGAGRLVSASHRPLDRVLGLATAHGWALVHTVSAAPAGLLVRLLDLLDPTLDPGRRRRGRALLAAIAPKLGAPMNPRTRHGHGSMLATVGGCLLASRVIADLSTWASHPSTRRGSCGLPSGAHAIELWIHATELDREIARASADPRAEVLQITGELVPMTDPQPEILAVALPSGALTTLGCPFD
ncbi:MAG: hypothetical protein KC636_18895 [Myxococcales bacterium]|nr:hypothetical protein [Myxococcales bacterium]